MTFETGKVTNNYEAFSQQFVTLPVSQITLSSEFPFLQVIRCSQLT